MSGGSAIGCRGTTRSRAIISSRLVTRWGLHVLFALGALVMIAGAAQAQPANAKLRAVAKSYVDAGLAAQSAGDYDTAITFYVKAYDLVPHPTLLFNIAQAHRL